MNSRLAPESQLLNRKWGRIF